MDAEPILDIAKHAAPLRQRVEHALREAIVSGRLAPGRRLTERELTEMTGVSRTLIREALRQLESEGLISVIPNRGPVVSELTVPEAEDLYAIRGLLEGFAARRFAGHADDAALKRLTGAADAVVAAYQRGDVQQALDLKNALYYVLFEGAGSAVLSSMAAGLNPRMRRWRALGVTHPARSAKRSREAIQDLKTMVAAIDSRDPEAAERATRECAQRGAREVMRLLTDGVAVRKTKKS